MGFVAAVALVASTAACGYTKPKPGIPLANPGRCVPVDIAAPGTTAPVLRDIAGRFNASSAARAGGSCAFVRVETVDSPVALRQLSENWPDVVRLGPAPVAWVPGSTMWAQLLDARLGERNLAPIAATGEPFARSPLVIAMPAPMAQALGYPQRPITWSELAQLARDPRGWGVYGHSEWGAFRLGKANPNWSTTALDQTVASDTSASLRAAAPALERSVEYYSDSTTTYFDNWRRLATKSVPRALAYLSAAISDERSVAAYNRGHLQTEISLVGRDAKPALPLVAIYPSDGTIDCDNPIVTLTASWVTPAARAGAQRFATFSLEPAAQAEVAGTGYRPGRGAPRADILNRADGTDPDARANTVAPASPLDIVQALSHWQQNRRPGRVLVLFDVSDSMDDTVTYGGPTKLNLARAALKNALDQLAPGDDIALRIFTTKLANPASPDWLDLVPGGPLTTRRSAIERALSTLKAGAGSPLYAAVRDAYASAARAADGKRIDGVVVLTDGYDEDDHGPKLDALLRQLGTNPDVHVFPIGFSTQSDYTTLTKFAQVTNATIYNARNVPDIDDAFARALANF